jgi:hypothetical protein
LAGSNLDNRAPLTVQFSVRASYDEERDIVVPGRLAHKCLDRSEKLVQDLSGRATSSLAEATQQPLVAEERATLIQAPVTASEYTTRVWSACRWRPPDGPLSRGQTGPRRDTGVAASSGL